ncbi:MAG TPA: chromate transporter [Candidatus Sulfotelmatobacter sp.]|nr:chromate transporter [Candidatus Sulfotelmatobacter sp.]
MAGSSSADRDGGAAHAPGVGRLYGVFLRIAMLSFGGGSLMWSQRVLVEELGWFSNAEFLNAVGMSQILPGPNLPNLAVIIGAQYRGVAGAGAALAGVTLVPLVILLGAGALYFAYGDLPLVQAALTGMSAAAAGTIGAAAYKMGEPFPWRLASVLVALVAFGAIAVVQLPLVLVLAVLLPLSVALAWFGRV